MCKSSNHSKNTLTRRDQRLLVRGFCIRIMRNHTSPVLSAIFWKSTRYRCYSSILQPRSHTCDFWLFPFLKKAPWGCHFSSNQEVVTASHTFFNSLSQADFEKIILMKWIERMNTCTQSRGQYFEKGPVTSSDSESDKKIFWAQTNFCTCNSVRGLPQVFSLNSCYSTNSLPILLLQLSTGK